MACAWPLQGSPAAQSGHPAAPSHTTSPRLPICVSGSGVAPSGRAQSAGAAGDVCRSGSSPPRATPTRRWPAASPAARTLGLAAQGSWPSLCSCLFSPENPLPPTPSPAPPQLGGRPRQPSSLGPSFSPFRFALLGLSGLEVSWGPGRHQKPAPPVLRQGTLMWDPRPFLPSARPGSPGRTEGAHPGLPSHCDVSNKTAPTFPSV